MVAHLDITEVLILHELRHADQLLLHIHKRHTDSPNALLDMDLEGHANSIGDEVRMAEKQILELADIARTGRSSELPTSHVLSPRSALLGLVYLHSHLLCRQAFSEEGLGERH